MIPLLASIQIERMKTVRDHYLARQAHEARKAREKGEVRATSSIMRLGIIGGKEGEDSDSSSSSSSKDSSASAPPPPQPQSGDKEKENEGKDGRGETGKNREEGSKGNQAEKKTAKSN